MKSQIQKLLDEFKFKNKIIEQESLKEFTTVEEGIKLSIKYLQNLRLLVRKNEFSSKKEEIKFFKKQKPYIYSRLKFYIKLYRFLIEKPAGSIKQQRNYIDFEIQRLQKHNASNLDFVKYYRGKANHLDKYYFLRGKDNIGLVSDTSHFYTDPEFSTSHDNLIAKIMAYDLLINHYQQELNELRLLEKGEIQNSNSFSGYIEKPLKWTASKTDLIELIYALQASGAIEDGMQSIKVMAMACEKIFNINLGNFYRTYLEIKDRKHDRTKFLDKMKYTLMLKMEKEDL